jgi:anti-anti-sigma factor
MDLGLSACRSHVDVALRGELDLVDAAALAVALEAIGARAPRIIMVDLAGLEFIDASGVAALQRGRMHARNAGGDLVLAAPQRQVRRVLEILWEARAPIQRRSATMRWRRMTMNVPAPRRLAVTDGCVPRGSRVPCRRPPAAGEIWR